VYLYHLNSKIPRVNLVINSGIKNKFLPIIMTPFNRPNPHPIIFGWKQLLFPDSKSLPGLPSSKYRPLPDLRIMQELIIAPSPSLPLYLLDEFQAPKPLRDEIELLKNSQLSWESIRLKVAKFLKAPNADRTADELINLHNLYAIVSQYGYRPEEQPFDRHSQEVVQFFSNKLISTFHENPDLAVHPVRKAWIRELCHKNEKPELYAEYIYHHIVCNYCSFMLPHPAKPITNHDANRVIDSQIIRGLNPIPREGKCAKRIQVLSDVHARQERRFSSFRNSYKRMFEIEREITSIKEGELSISELIGGDLSISDRVGDEMWPEIKKSIDVIKQQPLLVQCQYCYRFRRITVSERPRNGKVPRSCNDCARVNSNWERHLLKEHSIEISKLVL
jgi:hypothetical protein